MSSGVPLTIRLSARHMNALQGLGEVFHATPERMVAVWAEHQIDRLTGELVPDGGADAALTDGRPAFARGSADERRAAVLRAACAEFGSNGLDGASTEAIARRVGVPEPYLLRLFPTRKAIFLACVNQCFDHVQRVLAEAAQGRTGEEALTEMGRACLALLDDKATLRMQLQMWAAACQDEEVRGLARERVSGVWRQVGHLSGVDDRRVMQFLAAGMALGAMSAVDLPQIREQLGEALTGPAEPAT